MKKSLIAMGLSLGLVNLAIAFPSIVDKPVQCPSASSIKSVTTIENILSLPTGSWVSFFEASKYDTNSHWIFALSNFKADTKQDAYDKTIKSLDSLYFVSGPQKDESQNASWTCEYRTNEGYYGTATKQIF